MTEPLILCAMKKTQPFRYFLRVRYGECDQQGVVYNARYADYVDLACTEFLNAALGRSSVAGGGFEVQVVKLLIEWTAPAKYDDALEISVQLKSMGTTSFTLQFEMCKAGASDTIVQAETVNVHVDPKTWTKSPVPDVMRERLMAGARGQIVDHAGVFASTVARHPSG